MTDEQKAFISEAYKNEESPAEIAKQLGLKRTTVKDYLRRTKQIRTMKESAKLAFKLGRRSMDKALARHKELNEISEYRFNPKKFPWKGNPTLHPKWIKDRSKVKQTRMITEEKHFMKEVIQERNYTCELTKQQNSKLSVHHIYPVWKYPGRRFDKTAVIVICASIHKDFHCKYGFKADELDWEKYLKEDNHFTFSQRVPKTFHVGQP